jgi:hypothetical protein
MTAASTWAAYITARRNMRRVETRDAKLRWEFDAKAHFDAHWVAVDIEAAEGEWDDFGAWDAAGGQFVWFPQKRSTMTMNDGSLRDLDRPPINRYRWENKKRKARF